MLSDNDETAADVTIIGCGLMGASLATTIARSGRPVTVWNRSHQRAQELTGGGIRAERTMSRAVARSGLVIACVSDYAAAYSALATVEDWQERVVVNLTSGSSTEARGMKAWLEERNARYLEGAVFCYPDDIGTNESLIALAGDEAVWRRARETLELLCPEVLYVGHDPSAANSLLMGASMFYLPAVVACAEMMTFLDRMGAPVASAQRVMRVFANNLVQAGDEIAAAIATSDHRTAKASVNTYAEAGQMIIRELARENLNADVAAAATRSLIAGREIGVGDLGPSALTVLMGRSPQADG